MLERAATVCVCVRSCVVCDVLMYLLQNLLPCTTCRRGTEAQQHTHSLRAKLRSVRVVIW